MSAAPDTAHRCPARGCGRRVSWEHFMCSAHWFMISAELRTRVWRTWRDGHGYGSPEHAAAMQAAAEDVDRQLGGVQLRLL